MIPMKINLPETSAQERAHSNRLKTIIAEEIGDNNGFISFRRYMEMALYQPGLGYYVSGTRKFGASGDFVTAPEISPVFSMCLARQCCEVLNLSGGDSVLEAGAGSGIMAADVLLEMESQQCLPDCYYILEISPDLRQRQKETISEYAPHLLARVSWLDTLEGLSFSGVVIANELLDAMPVEAFAIRENGVFQRGVSLNDCELVWQEQQADSDFTREIGVLTGSSAISPTCSEFNPALASWMQQLSQCLQSGAMLLIDYGYTGSEYYLPQRTDGTLICHFKHTVIDDPLYYPGLVDISASVDFSAVAEAATKAGFSINGYTTQALFLIANELELIFQERLSTNTRHMAELSGQIKRLTLPSEMGERFQVIGLTKGVNSPLRGFAMGNATRRL